MLSSCKFYNSLVFNLEIFVWFIDKASKQAKLSRFRSCNLVLLALNYLHSERFTVLISDIGVLSRHTTCNWDNLWIWILYKSVFRTLSNFRRISWPTLRASIFESVKYKYSNYDNLLTSSYNYSRMSLKHKYFRLLKGISCKFLNCS